MTKINRSGRCNIVKTLMLSSMVSAFSITCSNPAHAQSEDVNADDAGAEKSVIIVTARKKEETLQEVPVTVTAIGGDALDRYQIDQVADVVSRVPTLNVLVGGSGAGASLSLRGVGSSALSAAFDSAVAFDFDGVQVSTQRIVQSGFFDTAQIDVLKGPQSLFFGKSATAGVFSVRSADPTSSWEIGGKGSYEFEEKGYTLGGYISGPISDTLGIRLAAQYNDIEEFAINIAPGASVPERGQKNILARATLQWDPTDRFNANLKVNYVRHENDGALGLVEVDCGANGVPDFITFLGGAVNIPPGYDCNTNDQRYFFFDGAPGQSIGVPEGQRGRERFDTRPGIAFGESDIWFGRLKWDLELSDFLTLSSVTGYLDQSAVDVDHFAYGGVVPDGQGGVINFATGTVFADNQLQQFSQELRLASDFDGMFNFMVGAFYEDREIGFNSSQQAVNIGLAAPDPTLPVGGVLVPGTGSSFDWFKQHQTNSETLSFFGSVTLDITDQLQLSGGIRYTDETKINTIRVPYIHNLLEFVNIAPAGQVPNFIDSPAFVNDGFFSGPIRFSDSNWSPEATIRYRATDDVNIYASFKTGFKSGGIDNSALPSAGLGISAVTGDFSSLIFDSETGMGGEIGVKSQWFDRDLTLNASIFYYVFDGLQVQNFDAVNIQFVTTNAAELTTQGVDVNWAWRTPVEGLSLSGAIAYTDAKYTDTFITGSGDDLNGREAARAPKWAGNMAFDWFVSLGSALELGLNGNLLFSDSYFTNEDTFQDIRQGSYVSIDGAISIGDPVGKWQLSLVGVNLTDEIWVNSSGNRPAVSPTVASADRDSTLFQNRGRQVFVEAKFKF